MRTPRNPAPHYFIGLDVGSTTVKAVVTSPGNDRILWSDYRRHETRQLETVLDFLTRIRAFFDVPDEQYRLFSTGSGGAFFGSMVGAKFVQEVTALSLAVEKAHPDVGSVIELGGQDAKMIFFRRDSKTGETRKILTMNDKCAGGTGAVIDKIAAKLQVPAEDLARQRHAGIALHSVAGKCGVFAETDVNTLQKRGIARDEIMASLFESLVQQNISVLTRGNTPRPTVILLGGPNTFIQGMAEAWRATLPRLWSERKVDYPKDVPLDQLILLPHNSLFYAAIGAIEFGKHEEADTGKFLGIERLQAFRSERAVHTSRSVNEGLCKTDKELEEFREQYRRPPFERARFEAGETVSAFIGIDGGSTSTKGVLLDRDGKVLCKAYQLSKGNPIQDSIEVINNLRNQVEQRGAELHVLGLGTTGYAKDILKEVLRGDVALVETVAHTEAAVADYPNVDVICDVGGQDIKIIQLKNGYVKDFKLNTQCSAGNGYFLQNTAQTFGFPVDEFAEQAFSAHRYPLFDFGCAVFLQSAIVDFQRQGWTPKEIMAGLAVVLPKNIWLYVCKIPNLAMLGKTFLLQGGTQYNLAAVKTQVDFIKSRFRSEEGDRPNVLVHKHAGECGAIGAAIESRRLYQNGHRTRFIGLDAVASIEYKTTSDERTRCNFCTNQCVRTFIDIHTETGLDLDDHPVPRTTKVAIAENAHRIIVASCEKGSVEDIDTMREIKSQIDGKLDENPNYAAIQAREIWRPTHASSVMDAKLEKKWRDVRRTLRIGIPRVLNLYSINPFFSGYFESLGIEPDHLVYSDFTSDALYRDGCSRGAVDPCFPSKLGIPHVHNLIYVQHKKRKLDWIFFPMIETLPTFLTDTLRANACPTVSLTPESVKAAFTKESDVFSQSGIRFLNPLLNFASQEHLAKQLFVQFKDLLGLTMTENFHAIDEGLKAYHRFFEERLRKPAATLLRRIEEEHRVGIVALGRPYHSDPGINHGILEQLQKCGYPIFTQDSLPADDAILARFFADDLKAGHIQSPRDIRDVWKNAYSENTNRKIWAAKVTARHPNLVALELSSFKCGHDAPTYTVIERIFESSKTPYFSFKEIDENKPAGSIKIRVETIDYFLKRYQSALAAPRPQPTSSPFALRNTLAPLSSNGH